MDIGLLTIRLVFGLTLAAHSAQKLFGWFDGPGIAGTMQLMEQLGFRPPRLQAVVAGLVEGGAGLTVAVGLLTPLGAAAFYLGHACGNGDRSPAKRFFYSKGRL